MNKLNYKLIGNGKKICFIHGNSYSHKSWNYILKKLDFNFFQVLLYDLRGHGKSYCGDEEFSLKLFSEDLTNLLKTLEFKPDIYIGFSDGANIILEMLKNSYIKDEKIILISPNFSSESIKGFWFNSFKLIYFITDFLKKIRFFKKIHYRMSLIIKHYKFKKKDFFKCKNEILIIRAEKEIIFSEEFLLINKSFSNSSLITVKGSTHFNILHKEKTKNIVLNFMGGTK